MKKKRENEPLKYQHIYTGIMLIIISILLTLSLIQGPTILKSDIETLRTENLSFGDFVTLNFPVTDNLIGPFGAFFGFFIYSLLGLYFAYSLLLALFIKGLLKIFCPEEKEYEAKVVFFIFFAFFLNLFLITVSKSFHWHSGIIIPGIHTLLYRVFSTTGTAIISLTICIGFMLAIIETNTVKAIFRLLFNFFKSFLNLFKATEHKKANKKVPARKTRTGKNRTDFDNETVPDVPLPFFKDKNPQITDHKDNRKNVPPLKLKDPNDEDTKADNDDSSDLPIPAVSKRQQVVKPPPIDQVLSGEVPDVYQIPSIDLFLHSPPLQPYKNREEIEAYINNTSHILIDKLARLGIEAEVVNVNVGPVITQFELRPAPNVKVSRFSNVSSDLALAIKAKSIRVQAPIPGKGLVGVEIPNKDREIIFLKEVLDSEQMIKHPSKLAIAMGKDIVGNPVITDLAKMPHLLIAGSTGSGKSVCVNSIICNLLFRAEPEELRLVLIDPKRIELSGYEGIPHLIQNIVSDNEEALVVLQWAVNEMERRYELLQQHNVRDITSFNKKVKSSSNKDPKMETLPFIIIVIDEFADLILKSGRDVEMPITRLAQMARAIGIHLIIATQRPSMKIITGLIKANFPAKIAFRVAQKIDSRVILDMNGAESLLGSGDMLMITPSKGVPERIHGTYVSDEEIENLVTYLRNQPKPAQNIEIVTEAEGDVELLDYDDELFPDAAKLVIATGAASVSMLQRHFKIGYARAGRLIDMLEQAKIIGKYAGSKSREVIVTDEIMDAYGLKN